jgi:predicted Zn finger-like uncharacterized protein
MTVRCPRCQMTHQLDDHHLTRGTIRVRCRSCEHVWELDWSSDCLEPDPGVRTKVGVIRGLQDLDRLFKLRIVVARVGEMDKARWWNTQGILGRHGPLVFKRGFPKTHLFAQARAVFSVARHRCEEIFNPPKCMTLWNLPVEVEDQFDAKWQEWVDDADGWVPFFEQIRELKTSDLLIALQEMELLDAIQSEAVGRLRRSAEGRAVPIPGFHEPNDEVITLLAAGFCKGEPGRPAIPYARVQV